MNDLPMYLNTAQIAALLGLSVRTLDRYRINGSGPPFYKFGQCVRYALTDVEAWARGLSPVFHFRRRRRVTDECAINKRNEKNGARGIDRAARATRAVPPVAVPLRAGIEGGRVATDTAFAESGNA